MLVTPDGSGARAYQRDGRTFLTVDPTGDGSSELILLDNKGVSWKMGEEALVSALDPSVRLLRIPGRSSFWFGWFAYSGTEVYSPGL